MMLPSAEFVVGERKWDHAGFHEPVGTISYTHVHNGECRHRGGSQMVRYGGGWYAMLLSQVISYSHVVKGPWKLLFVAVVGVRCAL